MVGRLHTNICNVPKHLLPGVRMQIKLTKARREFYLMSKDADSKVVFKLLDAKLLVKSVRPNPAYLVAHNTALQAGAIAKYKLTRVELKTFTSSNGSQSLCIDNAILGAIPKRLLFAMIDKKDFLGSLDTNLFEIHHYDMDYFSLYVNGKQIPSGSTYGREPRKDVCHGTQDFFEGSGVRH